MVFLPVFFSNSKICRKADLLNIEKAIQGAIKQDRKCQHFIYMKYAPMLMSVCRRYSISALSPGDILQESFVSIFKYLDRFDPNKGSIEGWMKTITIRTGIRLSKKYNRHSLDIDMVVNLPNLDADAIDKMSADELMLLVENLPEGYKQVFNLSVIDGYSHKEISEMLDMNESTSRSKLSRARGQLEKLIVNQRKKIRAI